MDATLCNTGENRGAIPTLLFDGTPSGDRSHANIVKKKETSILSHKKNDLSVVFEPKIHPYYTKRRGKRAANSLFALNKSIFIHIFNKKLED